MPILLVILLMLCSFVGTAGTLSGTVKDTKGNPLPFANVFVQGTTNGTTANENGKYSIDLPAGTYDISFLYISYRKKTTHVVITTGSKVLDVALEPEDFKLQEVVVNASEDPAYEIIRKAIAVRDKHYKQVKDFNCQTYVKGMQRIISAPNKVFGFTVNFDGSLDSNNAGIVYLSESVSDFTFRKPDDVKEVMISSKVSGKSNSFSWNRAADLVQFDFYKSEFPIEILSDQVFITPLADNAMSYYKYHLEGTYFEDSKMIYKIEVSPKHGSGPVFKGHIYIIDNDYGLKSIDLMLTKKDALINIVDTLKINYNYAPVNDSVSVPLSQRFDFNFKILGIKAAGYIVAVYRDYKINIPIAKKTFTNEVMKVSEESNTRTKTYWDSIRPVPLTEQEVTDYARKDTLEKKKESKSYFDSLDRKANKPSPYALLIGYNFRKMYHKIFVRFIPPFELLQYNTVEGWNLRFNANIRKEFKHKTDLFIKPEIRYGFANKHFNAMLTTNYDYSRKLNAGIGVEGGSYVFQFDKSQPISELINSLYTLFWQRNYMKLYEERFFRINHHIEPINGFNVYTGVNVSERYHLDNTSDVRAIRTKGTEISSNDPSTFAVNNPFLGNSINTSFNLSLRYQPGQKYISRPDMKIVLDSKWPSFSISYTKAIPKIFNSGGASSADYDFVGANIEQYLSLGSGGNSRYSVSGGFFPNRNFMGFMDYKHFDGNLTIFDRHYFTGFQLLNYYAASTNQPFFEAHYEHHLNGLLISRVKGLNKLKWQLVLGAHYLYNPDFKSYGELAIGIENIFRFLRFDFVNGLGDVKINNSHYQWGVRIGVNFNDL